MDPILQSRIGLPQGSEPAPETSPASLEIVNDATGEVAIVQGARSEPYTLLPLPDLYGPGNGTDAVDPQSDLFMPLFLCIEEAIVQYDATQERVNDAAVTLALNRLSINPDEA